MEGTIVWYSSVRGYGFIAPADGDGDVFFQAGAVDGDDVPCRGAAVTFEMVDGASGPLAASVNLVDV